MSNIAHNRADTLNRLLGQIKHEEDQISAMLPPDLPFDRFYATIHQALRQYPKILDCEPKSLLNAVIKAAYDGLRVDGREAVITVDETTFDKNTPRERKVKMARYMPMAYGIIQQILRGGEVTAMTVDVIRDGDEYDVQLGTDPHIFHKPKLESSRGAIIAAYSIATLKSGAKTFELLDRDDLAAIRSCASTDKVWQAWPGEMSKKSAARRHRKTLPLGDRDIVIRDGEAEELYPQFSDQSALPAPAQTQRPTRAAIANQMGTESGHPLDLQDEDEAVIIDQPEKREKPKPRQKRKSTDEEQARAVDTGRQMDADEAIPEDEDAWRGWAADVERKIAAAGDADAVNAIAKAEAARLEAAAPDRRSWVQGLIADRLTDFAVDGAE